MLLCWAAPCMRGTAAALHPHSAPLKRPLHLIHLPHTSPSLSPQYINGTVLDDRLIRVDFDWGFVEGRQFGRGRSGGQVRAAGRTRRQACPVSAVDANRCLLRPSLPPHS